MAGILDTVDQRTQLVGENRLEILMFRLFGRQLFAINVFKVQEVLQLPKLTLMPQRHRFVCGVVNLRGQTLPVIDLLMLDDANPRSVAFQTARIVEHLEALPATRLDGRPVELLRLARKLDARLANTAAEKIEARDIDKITSRLLRLSGLVTDRFFTQRPSEARPEELE